MPDIQPTTRFSDRVANYVKYRPGYPTEIYPYLVDKADLELGALVADLSSGTGLLSKLFLSQWHKVYAIEPNAEMRTAGEEVLAREENFVSLEGRAEEIPLPDDSVDFVTAGQAFHWFEAEQSRQEIARILRPGGQVALIWNNWNGNLSLFLKGYEDLLQNFGTDFKLVSRQSKRAEENLRAFLPPGKRRSFIFLMRSSSLFRVCRDACFLLPMPHLKAILNMRPCCRASENSSKITRKTTKSSSITRPAFITPR